MYNRKFTLYIIYLLAKEKGNSLRILFEERIVGTDWGEAKGDNLRSIREITKELENILEDRTNFEYDKFHKFSDFAYTIEMAFMGDDESERYDMPLTYNEDDIWLRDLLPKRKNAISIQNGNPIVAMRCLYDCQKAYDIVRKNNLWRKKIIIYNNSILLVEKDRYKKII